MPFDLEIAIATWRKALAHRRGFFDEDLEELERHLRDHTAHLIEGGDAPEEAFRKARAFIGNIGSLEKAYQNVFWSKLKHRKLLIKNTLYQLSMFKNYLTIALRNLSKHKGYSAINISGLAVGLACSFFIFLWIQNELSIDQFHEKGDQLYQVKINEYGGDNISTWQNVPLPLAETIAATHPEVENAVLTLPVTTALKLDDQTSRERGYFAGPGFFEAFSFPFIVGDPSGVLQDPSSIVICETVATKYFGPTWQSDGNVLGQTFTMDYWQSDGGVLGQAVTVHNQKDFTIAGVFEDVPHQSTLRFDVILPVQEVAKDFPHIRDWGPRWFELTLQLKSEANVQTFGTKIRTMLQEHIDETERQDLVLQPFNDVYLHGAYEEGKPTGGRIQQVYLLGLVVIQFSVSVFLMVGTLTVYQQLTYLQTKDLGLDKDNVAMIRLEGKIAEQYEAVRQSLLQSPGIEHVSRSSAHPLGVSIVNGNVVWEGKELDENIPFTVLRTDARFAQTMRLDLAEGRFFEQGRDEGALRFVVNETAVRAMGLEEPIGHPFAFGYDEDESEKGTGRIIGVVKDFHTGSLVDKKVGPVVFRYEPEEANFLLVRTTAGKTSEALAAMEAVHQTFNPGYLFEYTFLDEAYQAYYHDEVILEILSQIFAVVAIFIACLGLLGLSAFSVQQRTKEIGVRRVLGATKTHVMYILSLDFVKLVVVALLATLPLAYWAMMQWLDGFAYRIDLGLGTLLFAGVLSLIIALTTVGFQAWRATRQDPVQCLRYQ